MTERGILILSLSYFTYYERNEWKRLLDVQAGNQTATKTELLAGDERLHEARALSMKVKVRTGEVDGVIDKYGKLGMFFVLCLQIKKHFNYSSHFRTGKQQVSTWSQGESCLEREISENT